MESIRRLEAAVQYLRTEVYEEIPSQQIVLLLAVAMEEGITQYQLGINLGMPPGTVSRNVKMLGQWGARDAKGSLSMKGFNLLDTRPDVEERRRMAVFLTPKGRALIMKLTEILEGGKS